jgi:hypothetical protein
LAAAVEEYNIIYSGAQEEPFQPAIITMSSRRMEGVIYQRIQHDKDAQGQNNWAWNSSGSEGDSCNARRKRTASSSCEELRRTTLEMELQKCKEEITELMRLITALMAEEPIEFLERENAQLKRDLALANKNSDTLSDELVKLTRTIMAHRG